MRRGFLSLLVVTLWTRPVCASVLSDAAAQLQPGNWIQISTNNINPTLTGTGGASGFIFGYADSIKWDPVSRQLFYVGGDHNQLNANDYIARFVSYSDSNNTWQILPRPSWFPSSYTVMHGYDHMAVDPINRYFYTRYDRTLRRYNISNGLWDSLPENNVLEYNQCCGGVDYFPELNGPVWVQDGESSDGNNNYYAGVFLYNNGTGQWTRLGTKSTYVAGLSSGFAEYNPVHKVVLFGGGAGARKLYKLTSNGTITNVSDAPVDIGTQKSMITVDPVSGDYLFFSSSNYQSGWYVYKVETDTWLFNAGQAPFFSKLASAQDPVHGKVSTSIPTYGVNLFVSCTMNNCETWLYKHSATSGSRLPSDSAAPTISLTSPTNGALISSSVSLAANAADNVGVVGVQFKLDGNNLGVEDVTAPYSISWDTTGTANGSHTLTAIARDAANNWAASSPVSVTVSNSVTTPISDFSARCAAAGVIRCYGFDAQEDLINHINPPVGTPAPAVDTSLRASGTGSLKFTIAKNGYDSSGSFAMNFTPGSISCQKLGPTACSSANYPVQFGPGQTFYVQWRQRFQQAYLDYVWPTGGGWKQAIIGEGDRTDFSATSCTPLEIVTQNTDQIGLPRMYHSCGAKDGKYQPIQPGGPVAYSNYLQNGRPYPPGCLNLNYNSGGNCFRYVANEWLTFQVQVTVGTWYKNDGVYHYDSQIKLWAAREGQPSVLVLDTSLIGPGQLEGTGGGGYDLVNDNPAAKYGKVWLLPYHTGVQNPSGAPQDYYMWYDDLIISTNRIADPGAAGTPPSGDTTPPAAPSSLTLN